MFIFDMDIVVSSSDVELGEMFCIFEFVDKVRDKGKGIGISDGMLIQVAVVLAGVEFPILLFDKEKGESLRGVEGVDLS